MEDPRSLISRYAVGCTLHDMYFTTLHAPIPPLGIELFLVQVRKYKVDTLHLRINPSIAERELPSVGCA